MAREGNNPKRRIAPPGAIDQMRLNALAGGLAYEGSGHHKRRPGDYGFSTVNPRPWKSLCDRQRVILLDEARDLFRAGIRRGMVSTYFIGDRPKYVWAVDGQGTPFEAKIGAYTYHGYPLEEEDDLFDVVREAWAAR
jgi:hypothetical protein